MTDRDHDEALLETFFDAARTHAPVPSEALMARILADADRAGLRPHAPARAGLWQRARTALGGWQGIGGLATAAAAGLWVGYSGLADPAALTGGLIGLGGAAIELMPEGEMFALTGTEG